MVKRIKEIGELQVDEEDWETNWKVSTEWRKERKLGPKQGNRGNGRVFPAKWEVLTG